MNNSYTLASANVKPAGLVDAHSLTAVVDRIRDFGRQTDDILARTDSAASQISGTDNRDEPLESVGPQRPDSKVGEAHSALDAVEARLASIRWHLTRLESGL